MEPWPADKTKRSRSGQAGSAGSNFRNREKSTVAASAMPIGMPGWPLFAAWTAAMERARIALARRRVSAWLRVRDAAVVVVIWLPEKVVEAITRCALFFKAPIF